MQERGHFCQNCLHHFLRNPHFRHRKNEQCTEHSNIEGSNSAETYEKFFFFPHGGFSNFLYFCTHYKQVNRAKKSPDSILTMCMMVELVSFNIGITLICRFNKNNKNHPCKFTLSSSLISILFIRQISGLLSLYLQNQP